MKTLALTAYPADTLDTLLSGIPFFKDLMLESREQTDTLLRFSRIFEPTPGEIVVRKGDRAETFYFLLRGQLVVYPDGDLARPAVNYLSAGQVFGALSLLCRTPRTATIVADPKVSKVMLFGTDFTPFGDLTNFQRIKLPTKLAFWRMVAHNTRWKLEVYRMEHPDHPLSKELRQVEIFRGEKNTVDELQSLDRQIWQLTDIMLQWNEALAIGQGRGADETL
ncbi:MAG: cyclic nucleotide-binding domain-containing protein [Pseudomonadota bacterium]